MDVSALDRLKSLYGIQLKKCSRVSSDKEVESNSILNFKLYSRIYIQKTNCDLTFSPVHSCLMQLECILSSTSLSDSNPDGKEFKGHSCHSKSANSLERYLVFPEKFPFQILRYFSFFISEKGSLTLNLISFSFSKFRNTPCTEVVP